MRLAVALLALLPLTTLADTFTLTSPAFKDGGQIPKEFTCEGDDRSPPLAWSGVPAGTRSLVLIVSDPDAPDPSAPTMVWSHWLAYNLSPQLTALASGMDQPAGAMAGRNGWGKAGYGGPCPPIGNHRYYFRLYALDVELPDLKQPIREKLEHFMKKHQLGEAVLMGRYQKGVQP